MVRLSRPIGCSTDDTFSPPFYAPILATWIFQKTFKYRHQAQATTVKMADTVRPPTESTSLHGRFCVSCAAFSLLPSLGIKSKVRVSGPNEPCYRWGERASKAEVRPTMQKTERLRVNDSKSPKVDRDEMKSFEGVGKPRKLIRRSKRASMPNCWAKAVIRQ